MKKRQQPSSEALNKHAEDVALAGKFDELFEDAQQTEIKLREAQARRAPLTEQRPLAVALDSALTAVMRAAYAAQRAEIGPLGYDDRIYRRKAMARPDGARTDRRGRAAADPAREPPAERHSAAAARARRLTLADSGCPD